MQSKHFHTNQTHTHIKFMNFGHATYVLIYGIYEAEKASHTAYIRLQIYMLDRFKGKPLLRYTKVEN